MLHNPLRHLRSRPGNSGVSCEDYKVCGRSIDGVLYGTLAYKIPPYHRSYSWGVNDAAQLFEDLTRAAEAPGGSTNLLGTAVVSPEESGSPKFEVVDGQQRLATVALVLCAMRSCLFKFKGGELPYTRPALENALATIDGMLNVKLGEPRIELGNDDRALFRDILSTDTHDYVGRCKDLLAMYRNGAKRARRSNELLIGNYRALSKLVEKKISEFGLDGAFDGRKSDEFSRAANEFARYVVRMAKRNHFAFVTVHNKRSACKIFATFNTAGQKMPVPTTAKRRSARSSGRRLRR